MDFDTVKYNSAAWDAENERGNQWTIPVSPEEVRRARQGEAKFLLTPFIPVPKEWYLPVKDKSVLCLASGGGQQGPLFAALGADVSVFDNSMEQLKKDRFVAERDGLTIKTYQGDMKDLSRFENESFDLIFHPVSNCFIDDVNPVWQECYRVLRPGGALLAGFVNPITYIFDFRVWDDEGKLEVKYKIPYADTEQLPKKEFLTRMADSEPMEYGHSLDDLIGGQLRAGFLLTDLIEDKAGDLLDRHISTMIATRAVKQNNTI